MVRNYSILDRSRIRHYYRVRNGEQTNVNCRYHIIRTHSFSKILEAVCSLSCCDQLFRSAHARPPVNRRNLIPRSGNREALPA